MYYGPSGAHSATVAVECIDLRPAGNRRRISIDPHPEAPELTSLARHTDRVRKVLGVLQAPEYRRALRLGVAASVEHEAIPLRSDFATVIDVGANRGQFAVFAARRFPRAMLICFEPRPRPREKLRQVVGPLTRLRVLDCALGAADKQKVKRLDHVLQLGELQSPTLLKIDVQGGELKVLQGAEALLPAIDAVLVEVSFVELYAGQPLADAVWSQLRQAGFSTRGAWSISYGSNRECLRADLLFARGDFEPLVETSASDAVHAASARG